MKVLQLCNKPPYPPCDGGTMAMNSVTQGLLREGCEVKVLTVETDKHPLNSAVLPEQYVADTAIESVYVDLGIKLIPAAFAMLCGESYHVSRYKSDAFASKLREILQQQEFDIVHVESVFLTPYVPLIRKYSKAKIVLRAHNVEHLIWRRIAVGLPWGLKRWYMKHLSLTLRAYELEHLNDYDGVVCITRNDADYFRSCFGVGSVGATFLRPRELIPFGIEPEEVAVDGVEPASLFHIGAMDWIPNCEGVDWFLDKVWPIVHERVPSARLYLAGRKMSSRLMNAQIDGVVVVGEVADAMHFIGSKQINIVPLLSGSGIRVKIIEAMSMGKAVVSTTVGAQGIEYSNGVNLLIADTPEQFAKQIERLVNDADYCRRVGEAAARLVAEQYDESVLSKKLVQFYHKLSDNENE